MSVLKIAIQKNGRLHSDSLQLLKDCGIAIDNGMDQLKATVRNFPMEVLYLRNSDIPQYLEDGVIDAAIVGENLLYEQEKNVRIVQRLGFSKCRVSIAIPKGVDTEDISYLNQKRIATSYPNTLRKYLQLHQLEADIHVISGSVEIAPNIGLADGICDIVSSGSTLFKNGLKEIATLFPSEAVLAKAPHVDLPTQSILEEFTFRVQSVLKAKQTKYVLMNVPNERIEAVTKILPVLKSPTIMPLAEPGWSSLHSVIAEDTFWKVINELKMAGAEGILVIPIEKMIL
jgi:ATP phosphoribosyltransferase